MSFCGKSQDREAGHDNRPGEHPPEAQGAGQDQGPHARRKDTDTSHSIRFYLHIFLLYVGCFNLYFYFVFLSTPRSLPPRDDDGICFFLRCASKISPFLSYFVLCPNFRFFPKKVENLH